MAEYGSCCKQRKVVVDKSHRRSRESIPWRTWLTVYIFLLRLKLTILFTVFAQHFMYYHIWRNLWLSAAHKALFQISCATRETFSPRVSRVTPQTRISAQVTPFEQAITPLNGMTSEESFVEVYPARLPNTRKGFHALEAKSSWQQILDYERGSFSDFFAPLSLLMFSNSSTTVLQKKHSLWFMRWREMQDL